MYLLGFPAKIGTIYISEFYLETIINFLFLILYLVQQKKSGFLKWRGHSKTPDDFKLQETEILHRQRGDEALAAVNDAANRRGPVGRIVNAGQGLGHIISRAGLIGLHDLILGIVAKFCARGARGI